MITTDTSKLATEALSAEGVDAYLPGFDHDATQVLGEWLDANRDRWSPSSDGSAWQCHASRAEITGWALARTAPTIDGERTMAEAVTICLEMADLEIYADDANGIYVLADADTDELYVSVAVGSRTGSDGQSEPICWLNWTPGDNEWEIS